ncbi:MAG: chorismate synthase, partial [Deltaproteobacteria bacterium]|nr:chorismate synthase [Deltaproteobacteria bacterium]
MAGNSIGKNLVLTTFGESHGAAVGGILDGFPSLITIDLAFIQSEINRRNPAKYPFAT